jgi:hypothetical protein
MNDALAHTWIFLGMRHQKILPVELSSPVRISQTSR